MIVIISSLLAGCSSDAATTLPDKPEEEVSETSEEKPEKKSKKKEKKKRDKGSEEKGGSKSLAKRLCGRYVLESPEGADTDECYIMEVIEFADNLYAFCGQAKLDDGATLEAYSYWAAEFIPFDADALKSPDSDSVTVNEVRFSNMSNAERYWDPGVTGKITLKDDGLLFEGFTEETFLCPDGTSGLFKKNDRAEPAFSYLSNSKRSDDDLQGLWATSSDTPMYIKIDDSNVYVYQKSAGYEVSYIGGGCDITDAKITGSMNRLGYGGQPIDFNAQYKLDGDTLNIVFEGDAGPFAIGNDMELHRADEADVHVGTVGEIKYDWDSFGNNRAFWGDMLGTSEGFYGVWTAAVPDREDAINKAKKLNEQGLAGSVVYSPEWEGLNPEPYYCVTADKVYDEEDADYLLKLVQAKGYKDAYIKPTGARKSALIGYTSFGDTYMDVTDDRVLLENYAIYSPYSWRPEDETADPPRMTLIIDKDTIFDDKCETQFFSHYEDGDKPLEWFIRNYELSKNDTDGSELGLRGLFEISVTGYHVDRFYGTYWWD